jgi:uncharacterized membrane protein YgcG
MSSALPARPNDDLPLPRKFVRRTMKTTFWKTFTALALVLALFPFVSALGEARYPAQNDALTDDANALGQTMTGDIAAYAEKVEGATGVKLHVALVLFMDGEPAQAYADTLFTRWNLGGDDLLILGAAAEDAFALSAGADVTAKLSEANLKNLLYASGYSNAFKNQRYDDAFGAFFTAFNDLLAKQYDQKISLGSLFSAYQTGAAATAAPTATPYAAEYASSLWSSVMDSVSSNVQDYQNYNDSRRDDAGGLTPRGWIVLVIIALIIFGQGGARRAHRNGGCGCSPIGWILGGLGLGALFDRGREGEPCRGRGRRPRW